MGKAEARVELYLKERVEAKEGFIRKVEWVGHRGAPDRFVVLGGKVALVECKAPNGKLAPHQVREHIVLRTHGADVFVVATREGVDDFIKCMGL